MNSINIKRSIVLNGRKTSVSLEQEFWESFREIANLQNTKLSMLVRQIDETRGSNNLSSAIRLFVFHHLRAQLANAQVSAQQTTGRHYIGDQETQHETRLTDRAS
jgi:predicted DNA-binding ribbon-helix-helix protein